MLIDGTQVESAANDLLVAGRSGNNEMRASVSGLLNIRFVKKCCNSQLIWGRVHPSPPLLGYARPILPS